MLPREPTLAMSHRRAKLCGCGARALRRGAGDQARADYPAENPHARISGKQHPADVLQFALKLTPAVRLEHTYLPNDFTLCLYRRPPWEQEQLQGEG